MKRQQRNSGLIVAIAIILSLCLVVGLSVCGSVDRTRGTQHSRAATPVATPLEYRVSTRLEPVSIPAHTQITLFDAIRQVESGGNSHAVGDNGKSRGPYQISRAYWDDACEYAVSLDIELRWPYDVCVYWPNYCELIMTGYWARYGATTDEERMALHVAGPTGIAKMGTSKEIQAYIKKVRNCFDKGDVR